MFCIRCFLNILIFYCSDLNTFFCINSLIDSSIKKILTRTLCDVLLTLWFFCSSKSKFFSTSGYVKNVELVSERC